MSDCWFKDGLNFSCTGCSQCCCGEPGFVFLSKKDLTNLAECFKLSNSDFIDLYCRKVNWHGEAFLSLKETEKFDCIFWQKGKGCTVYEHRPVQCRTYPFWKRIIATETGWKTEKASCPGIGTGEFWSMDKVLEQMQKDSLNSLLKWDGR